MRGLLSEFASGTGPGHVTVLSNRHGEAAYAPLAGGSLAFEVVRGYPSGDSAPMRALAMGYGLALPRAIARGIPSEIDVMHFPLTVPIPRTRRPTVVTLHDLQHLERPGYFSRAERLFRRVAYEDAARRADAVVTPSEHALAMMRDRLAVDPARVVVAPHGVDHDRFTPQGRDDERLLAPFSLPERFFYYPANLWPHKNHRRLIEALTQVGHDDVELVLSGNPYGRGPALSSLAERLGVGDRVRHLGLVAHDVVPALMRRARAMVFPSLFEGFGQPALEAMACGCALAAPIRGALAEICAGAAPELDPEDPASIAGAIDALADDDDLVTRLAAAGVERARSFTWSRSADLHMGAYEKAVTAGRG